MPASAHCSTQPRIASATPYYMHHGSARLDTFSSIFHRVCISQVKHDAYQACSQLQWHDLA